MLGRARNRARKGRVQRTFIDFRQKLSAWVTRWQTEDSRGQYQSQLKSLQVCLEQVADAIEAPLAGMDLDRPRSDFYEECKQLELRLNLVQRLWAFYRERFDQREDPVRGPLLRAADEVVWSLRHPLIKGQRLHGKRVARRRVGRNAQ